MNPGTVAVVFVRPALLAHFESPFTLRAGLWILARLRAGGFAAGVAQPSMPGFVPEAVAAA